MTFEIQQSVSGQYKVLEFLDANINTWYTAKDLNARFAVNSTTVVRSLYKLRLSGYIKRHRVKIHSNNDILVYKYTSANTTSKAV